MSCWSIAEMKSVPIRVLQPPYAGPCIVETGRLSQRCRMLRCEHSHTITLLSAAEIKFMKIKALAEPQWTLEPFAEFS